jgi:hypothetical protein
MFCCNMLMRGAAKDTGWVGRTCPQADERERKMKEIVQTLRPECRTLDFCKCPVSEDNGEPELTPEADCWWDFMTAAQDQLGPSTCEPWE